MAEISARTTWRLARALRGKQRASTAKDGIATVSKVGNGRMWVRLPGSSIDTPVNGTSVAEALSGDTVRYHIENGRLSVTGNVSDPSVGSSRVDAVEGSIVQVIDRVEGVKTELVEADKVIAKDINAQSARIGAVEADTAKIHNLTAAEIEADHASIGSLDTNYARINATNITSAAIRNAWVNNLLVQTGLIANDGAIFTLDAIKVNAANITAGTLDVERLIVTVNGEKYLVHVDTETGQPSYEKLDGGVIEDLTITADKIVAGAITAEKITTQNLVGTGGWINLRNGTFAYANGNSGEGISWDGEHLTIGGDSVMFGSTPMSDVVGAAEQLYYDHTFTTSTDDQTGVVTYTFEARIVMAGTDVTNRVDPDFFCWWLRDESGDTWLGHGRTMTVTSDQLGVGYNTSVLGGIDNVLEFELIDDEDDDLVDNEDDNLVGYMLLSEAAKGVTSLGE